ncbi:MAG: YicC/YloC family endoribonuclease [Bacillota bacterium]|nr:YicC/YloC family endoribonuclease [Bacillota bacterium]
MIKSMTGYGHFEDTVNSRKISAEIKSVNHRFTDFTIKVPRQFGFLEEAIRQEAAKNIKRGKVDIYISIVDYNENSTLVTANLQLAKSYVKELSALSQAIDVENDVKMSSVASFPDIFKVEKPLCDEEQLTKDVLSVFNKAFEIYDNMKFAEGARLSDDLLLKGNGLSEYVNKIKDRAPLIVQEYEKRLRERMEEILKNVPIDEARLLNEVAIFTDRVNVDEEMVRLGSHVKQLSEIIKDNEPSGRRLDFLVQEINREVNTTGSKSNDVTTTKMVVEMKTEVEKMREQIQNIE